jgi:hypothetical protein
MAHVALLTMSDGRDFVALDLTGFCREAEDAVALDLTAAGHQVERDGEPVSTSDVATSGARRLAASQPDPTIFQYPVRALPHFTMPAASATSAPLLLLGSIDPHAFAPLSVGSAKFLSRYDAHHIHAVPGDRIAELQAACTFPGISSEPLGTTARPERPDREGKHPG